MGITVQLQQFAKLLNSEAGVSDDTAKGESIDRVVARDGQNARAVRHDDVLALTDDRKTRPFEGAHCEKMIDTRDLGQGLDHNFDFTNLFAAQLFVDDA